MVAVKEILETKNTIRLKVARYQKKKSYAIIEALKGITRHKEAVNAPIFFFNLVDIKKTQNNINTLKERTLLLIQYIGNVEKSKHIAKKVNLSTLTIDTHRKNIQKKQG